MKHILVTGGKGQLASCIQNVSAGLKDYAFVFVDYDELDILDELAVHQFFKVTKFTHVINCAAYTAVDKAESESDLAKGVNELGAQYLAEACAKNGGIFIQISTDFVFDGQQSKPYTEEDEPNPISVYGYTKLHGEIAVAKALKEHFIIRTSWLYSEYGNNFLKTMLRLGAERNQLNVVCDQIGTPTYAIDLANIILKIITEKSTAYGTYHFSNEGVASWYDFAKAIFELNGNEVKVLPIRTEAYPTPAKRPAFSVMDKSKIKKGLGIEIPYWRDSLKQCINNFT